MKLSVQEKIHAPSHIVWQIMTDIENSTQTITGIEKIEMLNQPESGLIGLKWQETRVMFGKKATEVMWITDASENKFYQTRAESHGSVYISKLSLAKQDNATLLSMEFIGIPQTIGTKIIYALTGWMFKNATSKALQADLADIKTAAEKLIA